MQYITQNFLPNIDTVIQKLYNFTKTDLYKFFVTRAHSSVWESVRFASERSRVRAPLSPPEQSSCRQVWTLLFQWGSKDERYRATVRWTVVTASDQATAVARIESLALRQNPIEVIASVGFLLCFHAQQSIPETHFRRPKDDDTPSINIPMVGNNIRHRRQVMFL